MKSNIEKYRKDLDRLIEYGKILSLSAQYAFLTDEFEKTLKKKFKDDKKVKAYIKCLPSFTSEYQLWYSEALVLIKQLLPDRLADFVRQYEKPKTRRKEITNENYVIEDALQGLNITQGYEKKVVVDGCAAIPRFEQQISIIISVKNRFESSLFDIRQLVQADLFDSELDSARELINKGFIRAAGAIAGVVLEGHLAQVCENHKVTIRKKNPGINDLAETLKKSNIIDTPVWRNIQRFADLRNLCDHKKKTDPVKNDIEELIEGVAKVIKTLF